MAFGTLLLVIGIHKPDPLKFHTVRPNWQGNSPYLKLTKSIIVTFHSNQSAPSTLPAVIW